MNQHIQNLLNAYQSGRITPEEKRELMTWYRQHSYVDGTYPDEEIQTGERILTNLMADIAQQDKVIPMRRRNRWYQVVAAVLFVGFLGFWGLYFVNLEKQETTLTKVGPIVPGSNQAELILEDGTRIPLQPQQEGLRIDQQLTYADGSAIRPEAIVAQEITLKTPKGGQYQITLSDQTKVWLNAGSSLTYPLQFTSKERLVRLEGEAYFEVKKQVAEAGFRPFIVEAPGQKVQVLGTAFNIEAYAHSSVQRTTLLEGSIALQRGEHEFLLKPGQQWSANAQDGAVAEVDVADFIAWKDGLLAFKEDNLKTIMDRIALWYDVEIVFQGADPNLHFGGTISKYSDLKEVLARLELTGEVKFDVKGRRIFVKP